MNDIPLSWFLTLSSIVFCIGLYGVIARRSVILVLLCVEIMMNAANMNLIAFWRYGDQRFLTGQAFALFGIAIAAAEVAVGLAIVLALFRHVRTVVINDVDELKG